MGATIYIYIFFFFPFSLFVSVYVYASVCAFDCIALLLPFVLRICLSGFLFFSVYFLALVIIGVFVFWFGCSLLSYFLFFLITVLLFYF